MDNYQAPYMHSGIGNQGEFLNQAVIEKMVNAIFQEDNIDTSSMGYISNEPIDEDSYIQSLASSSNQQSRPDAPTSHTHSDFPINSPNGNVPNGGGMFDLSGERCLIAPILPKILGTEMAEKVISAVGSPKERQISPELIQKPVEQVRSQATSFMLPNSWDANESIPRFFPDVPSEQAIQTDAIIPESSFYFLEEVTDNFYFQQFQANSPAEVSPSHLNKKTEPENKNSEQDWSDYRMFHPETVRKDFPVLQQKVNGKPLVWLDNGATTQKPQSVIDAVSRFYERDNSNIHRGAHTLAARATDAYESAREKISRFIGAPSKDDIVFVRGTTEGMNLLANTIGRQRVEQGDEIILTTLEHHANIVPWQMLAQERGAGLRVVPINSRGDIMMGEYEKLFNQRTRLVSITHVSNAIGTVVPVAEMIAIAHRRGVPVIIDGAQSVQHMTVNVQELDADFFVFSGHKLFAPTGIGVVYGKKEFLENMPPWQGGGNMIDKVTFEETTYNGVPARFEAGTPSIADAVGLGAAIDYVRKIGMENIHRYEGQLMEYMVESLRSVPRLKIVGNPTERAGALSFTMDGIPTQTVGQLLDKEGIAVRSGHHCAQPALRHFGLDSSVRPSLAFYNLFEDIDRLREALMRL